MTASEQCAPNCGAARDGRAKHPRIRPPSLQPAQPLGQTEGTQQEQTSETGASSKTPHVSIVQEPRPFRRADRGQVQQKGKNERETEKKKTTPPLGSRDSRSTGSIGRLSQKSIATTHTPAAGSGKLILVRVKRGKKEKKGTKNYVPR